MIDDRRVLPQHDRPPALADESGLDWNIVHFRPPGARAGQKRTLERARYHRDRQFAILADRVGVLERVVAGGRSGGAPTETDRALKVPVPWRRNGGVEETGRAVWREVRNPIEAEVWMQETVVVNA